PSLHTPSLHDALPIFVVVLQLIGEKGDLSLGRNVRSNGERKRDGGGGHEDEMPAPPCPHRWNAITTVAHEPAASPPQDQTVGRSDRKSTRLNSSHVSI